MRHCLLILALFLLSHAAALDTEAPLSSLNPDELFQAGLNVFEGPQPETDVESALQVWIEAASMGHIGAMYNLGMVYTNGLAGAPNHNLAVVWFSRAAELGDLNSMVKLAELYKDRHSEVFDSLKSMQWYERAAAADDPLALYNLGLLHEYGDHSDPDSLKAAGCYLKAAEQGFAEAQFKLGTWYLNGKVFEQNPLLAYVWLWLASVNTREQATQEYLDALINCEEQLDELLLRQARSIIEAVMECYERNRI